MDEERIQSLDEKIHCRVPFGTLTLTDESRRLIARALESNVLTRGPLVKRFEEQFARLFGARFAVAVSSGTDALAVALASLYDEGARRGDEVIVPALSFVATGHAVLQAGFMPRFVDISRETLCLDPAQLERSVGPRTRAILPVHLMGKPAPMDEVLAVAEKHGLAVIEDTAEAHGARYRGRWCGRMGRIGAFSLYAAHIVSTIEGGVVITDDENRARVLESLRNHGIEGKFRAVRIGFSAKMNELEAAVGLGNIALFDEILKKRRRNLYYLMEGFKPFEEFFITLDEAPHEQIGPHAFSIIVKASAPFSKEDLTACYSRAGIDSRNLFYSIPTQCPGYRFLGHRLGDFPEAEFASDHGLHIGVHQDLELSHLDYVLDVTRDFLKSFGCL